MSLIIGTETSLILYWDSIGNVPVTNPNSVSEWNSLFQLPAYGTPFNSVKVNGNIVTLMGGKNITMRPGLFNEDLNVPYADSILSIVDSGGCIVAVSTSIFNFCANISTITLPVLQNLGPTTGDDNVFSTFNFSVPITLTVPIALATVNGGFPDEDLLNMPAGSTINYV